MRTKIYCNEALVLIEAWRTLENHLRHEQKDQDEALIEGDIIIKLCLDRNEALKHFPFPCRRS